MRILVVWSRNYDIKIFTCRLMHTLKIKQSCSKWTLDKYIYWKHVFSFVQHIAMNILCNYTIAICAGQTNPTGACNQHEQVSTKFGMQWKYSQGSCISPENCHNCSIYYYNNGPRCTGKNRFLKAKSSVWFINRQYISKVFGAFNVRV